ncbi:hypothetical protein M426DRAFT_28413 [Hypoxylon sp. CI-4A]|nr:hypothetical protein M426DRAFT_28413 [Hypoxylon sp. CI-4A]
MKTETILTAVLATITTLCAASPTPIPPSNSTAPYELAVAPNTNQQFTCQTSSLSPGLDYVKEAVGYFRGFGPRDMCGTNGGCEQMYNGVGVQVSACGIQGNTTCREVSHMLHVLVTRCDEVVNHIPRVGGGYWFGPENSGTFVTLAQEA